MPFEREGIDSIVTKSRQDPRSLILVIMCMSCERFYNKKKKLVQLDMKNNLNKCVDLALRCHTYNTRGGIHNQHR